MVYVFIATITSDSYNVCSKDDIVTHLEDLSIYAKGI
jgi:putative heme iron utilization protein